MRIDGTAYRSIWRQDGEIAVRIFDQTRFPHDFKILRLDSAAAVADAIRTMRTRGAPLIGACGAYGLALALAEDPADTALLRAHAMLDATRPTAVNLRWALDRVRDGVIGRPPAERAEAAFALADRICDEDVAINRAIGEHGLALVRAAAGWRRSIGGRRRRRSISPTTLGSTSMSGSTRPGPGTRVRR
jgi:methylthioribose-1-phosphate isomerase